MPSKKRFRTKRMRSLPPLDLDEFNALTDLLFEATEGNRKAISRLLAIDRRTWDSWIDTPPEWPWWNIVLRHAIKLTLTGMVGRHKSPAAKHRQRIREALSRIPHSQEFEDEIVRQGLEHRGAEKHLYTLLLPGGQFWSYIRLNGNNGGYTERTLRQAARSLNVKMTQRGFGKDKDSWWELPD